MRKQNKSTLVSFALIVCCIASPPTSAASTADASLSVQLTTQGYSLLQRGNENAAMPVFIKALRADPRNIAARRLLARAQFLCGKPRDCIQQLQIIATVEPNVPSDLILLGRAYIALGKTAEARPPLTRALQITPADPDALLAMTDIHISQGRYAEAAALCKRVLSTSKSSAAINNATQKLSLIEQCSQESEHHPG